MQTRHQKPAFNLRSGVARADAQPIPLPLSSKRQRITATKRASSSQPVFPGPLSYYYVDTSSRATTLPDNHRKRAATEDPCVDIGPVYAPEHYRSRVRSPVQYCPDPSDPDYDDKLSLDPAAPAPDSSGIYTEYCMIRHRQREYSHDSPSFPPVQSCPAAAFESASVAQPAAASAFESVAPPAAASQAELLRRLVRALSVLQHDVDRALSFAEAPPRAAYDPARVFALVQSSADALGALARWQATP